LVWLRVGEKQAILLRLILFIEVDLAHLYFHHRFLIYLILIRNLVLILFEHVMQFYISFWDLQYFFRWLNTLHHILIFFIFIVIAVKLNLIFRQSYFHHFVLRMLIPRFSFKFILSSVHAFFKLVYLILDVVLVVDFILVM